ncbi:MAG TPA: hypothetical protein DCL63_02250 [Firmicutes bacterium]|jgi:TRAP-type C4-dicarboxylate transport system permease small subunit|nr:hypothetical protein [Bacillota bacterium]
MSATSGKKTGSKASSFMVIEDVLVNLCALMLAAMAAITLIAVFYRYVLGNALSWTEELTRYLMIFVGLFGTAVALRRDEHVGFTMIVEKLPPVGRRVANIISYAGVGIFCWIMAYDGYKWASWTGTTAEILPIPMWIPCSMVPISGAAMLVVVIAKIWHELRGEEK